MRDATPSLHVCTVCMAAFRATDEVPKTSVGKFDKKLLRARYAEGALTVVEEPAVRTAR